MTLSKKRLWLAGPLLCGVSAWCADSAAVPVGNTGWSIERPQGFGEAKAEGVQLRLDGKAASAGPVARIEIRDGWRVDPFMCPDKNGDPVRPLGRAVRTLPAGRAIYTFTCADPITTGAYESRRIVLRGRKLEDRHDSLSATLTFFDVKDGRTIYLPHGGVDSELRDFGEAAFEKAVASLHLADEDLADLRAPLQPAVLPALLAPMAIAK